MQFWLTFNNKPPIHNKLEYFISPIKKYIFSELLALWKVCSFTVYCTQYLVGAPFALITASIRHGHGGDQIVALLRLCGSPGFFDSGLQAHLHFWSLVYYFPLDTTQ